MVALLHRSGALPSLPPEVEALSGRTAGRDPRLEEIAGIRWQVVLEDHGGPMRMVGILGTREIFHLHTSSDRIEIVHLAGTRRAIVDLLRFVREEAEVRGMGRPVGHVDVGNQKFVALAQKLGWQLATLGLA